MKSDVLLYDGGTYQLEHDTARDLLERGVIVVVDSSGRYALAPEHVIDEVEPLATVLSRLTGSIIRVQETDQKSAGIRLGPPNGFGGRRVTAGAFET